ncbi:MAG: periplasmic heavy metal sensor [Chthoniobacterales bacterium]|nr:periplasmic heavy metal sensor [Chthoniobacterales bacterium]
MRKSLWCVTFLGIGLLAGAAALRAAPAGAGDGGAGNGQGLIARIMRAQMGRMMTLRAELNLTDEQRDAVKQTLQSRKSEIVTAVKPVVAARRTLRDAVLAEKPDDATIRQAADALGKSIGDAAVTLAKVKVELAEKAQLSEQQMQKIADFRADSDASIDSFLSEAEKSQ